MKSTDRAGGQLRGDKECPFSGVTKSGRVWRKVPESDARSVISTQTFRRALTAAVGSCEEILKECPFSGVKDSGRVWRKVSESDARSVLRPMLPFARSDRSVATPEYLKDSLDDSVGVLLLLLYQLSLLQRQRAD